MSIAHTGGVDEAIVPNMFSPTLLKSLRAIIFDMDGTLIDSNDAHAQAWAQAFQSNNFQISFKQVRPLIGMGSDKVIPKLINITDHSLIGEKLKDDYGRIFKENFLPNLKSFPGTRNLCEYFARRDVAILIASSAENQILSELLKIAEISDLVEQKTSKADAKESKPDPDIVKAALDKAGLKVNEAVFVGDTPYDVQAAMQLKLPVIGMRCGGWSDEDLKGAVYVAQDPSDLLKEIERQSVRG